MKRITLFTCLIVFSSFLLQSIKVDEDINLKTRTEINTLNRQVVQAIEQNNTEMLQAMCSEEFAASTKCREIVSRLAAHASMSAYGRGHEFQLTGVPTNTPQKLCTKYEGDHNFCLEMVVTGKENYISTIEIGSWTSTVAIFTSYIKEGAKWMINDMDPGLIRLNTKDAVSWYEKAKDAYTKGSLIDAAIMMDLCNKLVKPVPFFRYGQDAKMKLFYEATVAEMNKKYTFPLRVPGLDSLEIFNVELHLVESGLYPLVYYKSDRLITDTTGLSIECDKLHSKIGSVFKNIDTYNEAIFYKAVDEIPTQNKPYNSYSFFRKNNSRKLQKK